MRSTQKNVLCSFVFKNPFSMVPLYLTLAVVFFLVGTGFSGEAAVRSIRVGMQPKGPRIAIDLDEAAEYGIMKSNGRLYIQIKTLPREDLPGTDELPRNEFVQGYRVYKEGDDTFIEVVLKGESTAFRHFAMTRPDRIIIDFFRRGEQPPPIPRPVGMIPLSERTETGEREKTIGERMGIAPSKGVEGIEENLEIPLTTEELVFNESGNAHGFELVIPEDWKILKGCSVELVLSESRSSGFLVPPVDVFLNDFPLEAVSREKGEDAGGKLVFTVPPGLLQTGTNRLVLFGGGMEESSGDILLKADSRLLLNARLKHDLRLSDFPGAFLSGGPERRTLIVMPEGFSTEMYQAGLRLMQALQKETWSMPRDKETPVPEFVAFPVLVKEAGSGKDFSGDHMIFLGGFDSFDAEVISAFGVSEKTDEESAFLSCFSNSEGASRLFIGSAKPDVLGYATEALLQGYAEAGLDNKQIWIGPEKSPVEKGNGKHPVQQEEEIAIAVPEAGTVFKGEGRHRHTFSFDTGLFPKSAVDARLGMMVRHSPRLDKEASRIAFTVNGRKTGPVPLDFSDMGGKMLVLPVPPDEEEGFLDIGVEVFLQAKKKEPSNSAWTSWCVLEREAKIFFRGSPDAREPFLENIALFMRRKTVKIYAGESVDISALNMLNSFFMGLKGLGGRPPEIFVKPLNLYPGTQRTEPAIILGSADEISRLEVPLAVGYDEKKLLFYSSPEKIPVSEGHEKESVLFQLFEGDGKNFSLVVTWPSDIPWTGKLKETLLEGKIEGSVCLVNAEGKITARKAALRETLHKGIFDVDYFVLGLFIIAVSGVLFGVMHLFLKHKTRK
ncbi:MAG: hypothetical protein ACLFN0_06875 [Thermovirgaceae bacterium]